MNYETGTYDPSLKYAMGVRKGTRLDDAGMDYRIIQYQGREVAMFKNGMMAPFYRDTQKQLSQQEKAAVEEAAGMNLDWRLIEGPSSRPDGGAVTKRLLMAEAKTRECFPSDAFPRMHAALKAATDSKSKIQLKKYKRVFSKESDQFGYAFPVYCWRQGGVSLKDFTRGEVGKGLREYLWLYEKFREQGRNWFSAAYHAADLYFL